MLATGYPGKPFLAAMLRAVPNLGSYAYAVSVHPYQGDGASPRECSRPRACARREAGTGGRPCSTSAGSPTSAGCSTPHGARRVRIWITEVGWSSAPGARNGVTKAAQARYVRQVFDLLRTRYRGMVVGPGLVRVPELPGQPWDQEDYFGLVQPGGAPKPAWHAFARQARRGL